MSLPVEIMSVGTWNNVPFTLDHLNDMASNFNKLKDIIKPPIKLGHSGDQTGKPSLGWVTNLKVVGNKLVAFLDNIPDILMSAVKKKLYKRVSLEMMDGFKYKGEKFGRVLTGLAFLGAEMPAVKDLADLQAYMIQKFSQEDSTSFDKIIVIGFNEKPESEDEMEIKDLEKKLDALTEQFTALSNQNAQLVKDNATLKAENEKFKTSQKKFTQDETRNSLKTFCEEQVKSGKMTPAQRDFIIADEKMVVFSGEDASITIPFDTFKKYVEKGGKFRDDKKFTKDGKKKDDDDVNIKNPQQEVEKLAEKYMAEHQGVSYVDAVTFVLKDNEKLAEAYTADFSVSVSADEED